MNLLNNLHFSLRLFFKNLSTSLIAVLVLSVGLAMSLTMFTLSKMMMWDSPEYIEGKGLVMVNWINNLNSEGRAQSGVNIMDYLYFAENNSSFTHLSAFHNLSYAIHHPGADKGVNRYQSGRISGNFFELLNVKPLLGRLPVAADGASGAEAVVVIGNKVWKHEFDAAEDTVGKTLLLDGTPHTVIGVMPEGFSYPFTQQIWKPYDWAWEMEDGRDSDFNAILLGELKPGISYEQAKADLENLAAQLREQWPEHNKHLIRLNVEPSANLIANQELRTILYIQLIGALFVLMIACANVSNLLLARVSKRQFELNMRKVLGARRLEIIFQVVLDALIIAFFGAVLAFLMAAWAGRFIWTLLYNNYADQLPFWWSMEMDVKVFLFGLGAMIFAVILSSVSAILKINGRYNAEALKDNSRTSSGMSSSRGGKVLVTVQIALTVTLMAVGSIFSLSIKDQLDRQLPWDASEMLRNILYVTHEAGYNSDESVIAYYDAIEHNLSALPGIQNVSFAYNYGLGEALRELEVEGQTILNDNDRLSVNANIVTESFFELFGAEPLQGRFFQATDNNDSRAVVVINQAFANELFPGENPIGKRVRVKQPGNAWEVQNRKKPEWTQWLTVIGVSPALTSRKGYEQARASGNSGRYLTVYLNNRQWPSRVMNLLATGDGDVRQRIPEISKTIAKQSTKLAPIDKYMTVQDSLDEGDTFVKLVSQLIQSFAVLALLMAGAGLYGIASFTAQQKQREYGIHMALGAGRTDIVKLIFKSARWQLLIGLIAGFSIAHALGVLMEQALSGNGNGFFPDDTQTDVYMIYLSTFITVVLVLGIALLVPALRSAKLKPNAALQM